VALWPAAAELLGGVSESEKFAPVPLSGTVCWGGKALSAMVSWPVTGPLTVGVKTTSIEHVWPGLSTDVTQLLLSLNGPVATMLDIASG
jgi:hypothetical protein